MVGMGSGTTKGNGTAPVTDEFWHVKCGLWSVVCGLRAERGMAGSDHESTGRVARTHADLRVFQRSFEAAMRIFEISKSFPNEEKYSLTDQMRRSSRSVSANIAEAWRRRRYPASFVKSLTDAEAEAAEVQVWLSFAMRCGYLDESQFDELRDEYSAMLRSISGMIQHRDKWCSTPAASLKRSG